MKNKLTLSLLILSSLIAAQEKINVKKLQEIARQAESRTSFDWNELSRKSIIEPNLYADLQAKYAGKVLGFPTFFETHDSRQHFSHNTDLLYGNHIPTVNLSGVGMTLYAWDGGLVRLTHNEFEGRVSNLDTGNVTPHMTGVAGILMGAGNYTSSGGVNSRGAAYQANLKVYNFTNHISELATESSQPENADYMISNHSYGSTAGWKEGNYGLGQGWYWFGADHLSPYESFYFGYYDANDRDQDDLIYNAPQHIMVKSAGNENQEGPETTPAVHYAYNENFQLQAYYNVDRPKDCGYTGYDCIASSSLSKNIITVGSVLPLTNRYQQPSDVILTPISSVGPADDGRIKPDLVAVGSDVYMPGSASNSQMVFNSGTSFAAPAVAGNILLLQQLYNQKHNSYLRADLAKALVIHTANEAGEFPGPDYKFGWGLLDAEKAAQIILGKDETSLMKVETLQNGETYTYTIRGKSEEPIKATLVWIDPAAELGEIHNDRTPKLVNDLDLRISDSENTYFPWVLDVYNPSHAATKGDNVVDNVEQLLIENPQEGELYTITISHKNNLVNNLQVFALVLSGADFCPRETVWDGEMWSNGEPDFTQKAIIGEDLTVENELNACEIEIANGVTFTVNSNAILNLNHGIINKGTNANFVLENNSNLIQNHNAKNYGEATVIRHSDEMVRLDYTMWSSPVLGQNLQAFSPQTVSTRIYTYDGVNYFPVANPENSNFETGRGYLFRAPNDWIENGIPFAPQPYIGQFKGQLLNGNITQNIFAENYTSVGNPYPSSIDANELLDLNPGISTLYFWTNTNPADGEGGYTDNNYATYTKTGGVAAAGSSNVPNGKISVGQGFIIESIDADEIKFENSIRTDDQAYFFKNSTQQEDKNRFWLNLEDETGTPRSQILIAYLDEATHTFDPQYDGEEFGQASTVLYSTLDDKNLVIQAKGTFETTDVVPLGLRSAESEVFKIRLEQKEGIFSAEQKIYLKDKYEETIHDLTNSPYEFKTVEGEFSDRFEIVFQTDENMNDDELNLKSIQIYTQNQQIFIESQSQLIQQIEIYDLAGSQLLNDTQIQENKYSYKGISNQIYLIKVTLADGYIVMKKIII